MIAVLIGILINNAQLSDFRSSVDRRFTDLHSYLDLHFSAVDRRLEEMWGFRRSRTLNPGGIRTAFRDDPEHHRSAATLAPRLCKKCSASSRETYPKRREGRMPLAEKRGTGKGAAALVPASAHSDPERDERSGFKSNFRIDHTDTIQPFTSGQSAGKSRSDRQSELAIGRQRGTRVFAGCHWPKTTDAVPDGRSRMKR